jgi:hypothetical protein
MEAEMRRHLVGPRRPSPLDQEGEDLSAFGLRERALSGRGKVHRGQLCTAKLGKAIAVLIFFTLSL